MYTILENAEETSGFEKINPQFTNQLPEVENPEELEDHNREVIGRMRHRHRTPRYSGVFYA